MIKWLSNLLTRSQQVKTETQNLANTAARVGSLFNDLAESSTMPYDDQVPYKMGQYFIYGGALVEVVLNTNAGDKPDSPVPAIRAKFSIKLVTDVTQVTAGNNLPVSAAAVHAKVQQINQANNSGIPAAAEGTAGKIGIATDPEVDEGVRDDVAITPKKLKNYLGAFFKEFVTPTLDQLSGYVTTKAIKIAGLVFSNLPLSPSAEDEVLMSFKASPTDFNVVKAPLSTVASRLLPLLQALGIGNGGGGGNTGGPFTFTAQDFEQLAAYFADYAAWSFDTLKEISPGQYIKWPKPTYYPILSGTVVNLKPSVNRNYSRWVPGSGLLFDSNCSNGEDFSGRVIAGNGPTPADTEWKRLDRYDGTAANGSYSRLYGFLKGGYNYKVQIRYGVDNTTIQEVTIDVPSTEPVGLDEYYITGNPFPVEGTDETYKVMRKYSDGNDRLYDGFVTPVLDGAPAGVGLFGNSGTLTFSSTANSISVDTPITLIAYVGKNVFFSVTLKNATNAAVKPKITNTIVDRSQEAVSKYHVLYANAKEPAEVTLTIYQTINGVDTYTYGDGVWTKCELKAGEYNETGATVEAVLGIPQTLNAGQTYKFYYTWRVQGVTIDQPGTEYAFARHQAVDVTMPGAGTGPNPAPTRPGPWEYDPQPVAPNTTQEVNYRFVKGGGVGNYDLLEIRMLDTYPNSPMYIDLKQGNTAFNFGRGYEGRVNGYRVARFDTGFYGGLNLRVGFSTTTGVNNSPIHNLSFAVPTANTSGYVKLYPA